MEQRPPRAELSEIVVFTRVVQGGSFTAAATSLGMPRSSVSRKLAELEARIGARLLQRTTRSVSLTDAGRGYYEHCVRALDALEAAERAVTALQSAPRGTLRVTIPATFPVLGPILAEYLRRYPEVKVEMHSTDRRVDLVAERFDLALRAGSASSTSLVAKQLGVVRRCVLGAPELLARIGPFKHPSELARHDALLFEPDGATWTLSSGDKHVEVTPRARLVVNDYDILRSVTRTGFGLALLPEYQSVDDVTAGRLARALPGWSGREVPVFALYPSGRNVSPKVRALLELLRARLAATLSPAAG